MNKIEVCKSVNGLREFLKIHPREWICLYLAEKTSEAWDISTSRVYMNQIDKNFIYLPVNIAKGDWQSIREVYTIAQENKQIIAINQTQPHKSNPVQREWFKGEDIPLNVDSLIKDQNCKLRCFNLNGPSFLSWFEDEVSLFENTVVIVFGVGGVGEPIARSIADRNPQKLYLVDLTSKKDLSNELSKKVEVCYYDDLGKINLENKERIIFINCTGKEGGNDNSVISILKEHCDSDNIFVDLRPQLDIPVVNLAKQLGWLAYTGYGMNSRNDYVLLQKIQEASGIIIPTFLEFAKLVEQAS